MRKAAIVFAATGVMIGAVSSIASLMGVATTDALIITRLSAIHLLLTAIFLVLLERGDK